MKLTTLFIVTFVTTFFSEYSFSQIIHETGSPISWSVPKASLINIPTIKMPSFDVQAMLNEDLINDAEKIGPWRFGKEFKTSLSTQNSGVWQDLNNGERLWLLELESSGALSMNIIFDEFVMVPGDQLFIYSEDRKDVLGPLTYLNNKEWKGLATLPIQGDKIIVELRQRHPLLAKQSRLTIGQVTHGYRDIFGYAKRIYEKGLGDSGPCNNNVICPEGDPWRCEISSVAIIVVNGSGSCTGTVLNNHSQDERPLFLSANHCGTNVTNWVFRFNWDSPTCTPTQNGPTNQSVSGATLLSNSAGSDFALMELSSNIPASYNVYYSGWDATGDTPTNQTAIHHPSADVKKISFDNQSAQQATWGGAACWRILNWEDGTTEPGSSGSGLWDQDHHLIGQLYGGTASCGNNIDDYYGRLSVSWDGGGAANNRVKDYLDPNNTGVKILDGKGTGLCAGITYDNDGSILSIDGVDDSYCNIDNTSNATFTLKNAGNLNLTTASIAYDLNSGAQTGTIPWSGNLVPGATEVINLPQLNFTAGPNTLTVTASSPNGVADQNVANDTKTRNFNVILNGVTVTIDIIQDDYGSETSWEINDGTNVLYTGGPYSDGNDQVLISTDVCLSLSECYNFVIYDSYGDGICCAYGNGSYTVGYNGAIYATGGTFGSSETTNFCVTLGLENKLLDNLKIYPNPSSGIIYLDFIGTNKSQGEVHIINASGQIVHSKIIKTAQTTIDLSENANGLYFLEVVTEEGKAVFKVSLNK